MKSEQNTAQKHHMPPKTTLYCSWESARNVSFGFVYSVPQSDTCLPMPAHWHKGEVCGGGCLGMSSQQSGWKNRGQSSITVDKQWWNKDTQPFLSFSGPKQFVVSGVNYTKKVAQYDCSWTISKLLQNVKYSFNYMWFTSPQHCRYTVYIESNFYFQIFSIVHISLCNVF